MSQSTEIAMTNLGGPLPPSYTASAEVRGAAQSMQETSSTPNISGSALVALPASPSEVGRRRHRRFASDRDTDSDSEAEDEHKKRHGRKLSYTAKHYFKLGRRAFLWLWWLSCVAIMTWFTYTIIVQLRDSLKVKSTSLSYSDATSVDFPTITICNWNTEPANQTLPFAHITLQECINVTNIDSSYTTDCSSRLRAKTVQSLEGLFHCYQFNWDPTDVISCRDTGYTGAVTMLFNISAPPDNNNKRLGLQVTFSVPALDSDATAQLALQTKVYNEMNYAPAGFDTFFALQKQIINNVTEIIDWTVTTSSVGLYNASAIVSVSVAYKTLSSLAISYYVAYDYQNFFGDFAGMIGTLMGVDVTKLGRLLAALVLSCMVRTLRPISRVLNG